jgi:hypothetical protein
VCHKADKYRDGRMPQLFCYGRSNIVIISVGIHPRLLRRFSLTQPRHESKPTLSQLMLLPCAVLEAWHVETSGRYWTCPGARMVWMEMWLHMSA